MNNVLEFQRVHPCFYDGQAIRVVERGGVDWFSLEDCSVALGVDAVRKAVVALAAEEFSTVLMQSPDGQAPVRCVSLAGVCFITAVVQGLDPNDREAVMAWLLSVRDGTTEVPSQMVPAPLPDSFPDLLRLVAKLAESKDRLDFDPNDPAQLRAALLVYEAGRVRPRQH